EGRSWDRRPNCAAYAGYKRRKRPRRKRRPMTDNPWAAVLAHVRAHVDPEDYRRWFSATAYASDSTDQITVWVPSEAIRRHIERQFQGHIDRALLAMGRD